MSMYRFPKKLTWFRPQNNHCGKSPNRVANNRRFRRSYEVAAMKAS